MRLLLSWRVTSLTQGDKNCNSRPNNLFDNRAPYFVVLNLITLLSKLNTLFLVKNGSKQKMKASCKDFSLTIRKWVAVSNHWHHIIVIIFFSVEAQRSFIFLFLFKILLILLLKESDEKFSLHNYSHGNENKQSVL